MIKGKSIVKSNQSKPKGLSVGFNDQGLKKSNKPGAPKFGAGKQFKQKGPGPAPKMGAPKGGKFAGGKPSAKPSKKQLDEDDDEFDEDEEGDFEDLNEDDFDEEEDDDDDEDDVDDEEDDLEDMGDEDADDMDEDEPTSKKAKGPLGKTQNANAKGKAAPAGQAQNAKQNKQPQTQAKPLRQAQKDNQKAETTTTKPAQTGAPRESAAKKPSVPAAFAPGRGAPAKNDAEDQFWEAVAKMQPLTPEQAKRVDDLLSSEGKRILFVKNIPQAITASQIKALSSDILTVRIPTSAIGSRKKHKKQAKFAFVEFASEALAQKNIAVIGRASFDGQTLHAALARGGEGDDRSMRASDWKVGLLFVGGINPSAPGGGGEPTGSETALTARQAATEKAVRALLPNSDEVLVPINTSSLQLRGFAFARFNDVQKAIAAFDELKKKALGGQPPMLFGSKVFVSLAREKHNEKQPKAQTTQPQAAKEAAQTPSTPTSTADVKATPKSQAPQQAEVSKEDESSAKRARLTSGGSVASTGSASGLKTKSLLGSPAVAPSPASPAVSKPSPATPKTATPQGKQQPQQTSGKKEQAPPAKKQELAKGKGTPTVAGKANKQGAQAAAKSKQPGLQKAGAKRPLDEDDDDDDDDDDEDNWVDDDDEDEEDDDEGDE